MLNIELRHPEDVMKLSRLGSFHQSKLSFLRSFIREFKNWKFNRDIFDLDKYKIMYDRNGENHYDMIKRDDAKNLENYNYIKNQILKY